MRTSFVLSCLLALVLAPCYGSPRHPISLDGTWQFKLDPQDRGIGEAWYREPDRLDRKIRVPGIWQAQGFGEERGQLRHDYQGIAWYGRAFTVPFDWQGRKVWLHLGGVLRRARIYVNGKEVGNHEGLMTSSKVDLGRTLKPDVSHWLAIRVDNQMRSGKYTPKGKLPSRPIIEWDYSSPMGAFNHIGNWGGIYRSVYLESTGKVWLDQPRVETDIDGKTVTVFASAQNELRTKSQRFQYQVTILDGNGKIVAHKKFG